MVGTSAEPRKMGSLALDPRGGQEAKHAVTVAQTPAPRGNYLVQRIVIARRSTAEAALGVQLVMSDRTLSDPRQHERCMPVDRRQK